MKTTTIYIADDGMIFANEAECLNHELTVGAKARSLLWDRYNLAHILLQHMKARHAPYESTLPTLQDEVLQNKKKFLAAKKDGINASKAERFGKLAVLQYEYFCAKCNLKAAVERYRKNKANLRELGKQLGFKSARPAEKEVK